MNSAIKPWHRNSELKAFERVELSMKFGPEPDSSGIDTESEGDSSFSVSESGVIFPPPGLPSPLFRSEPPLLQDLQLKEDVVSGRWNLCITRNAMTPLPPPWHPMSSKWLRGDMDVHLSQDTRSITAEFALLGMDGVIKSRQFEMCGEGVCVWVRFVAQMPITTAKKTGDVSQEDNRLFEPSELNCGCLTFYEKGRVTGVLECERYGSFEFEGVRIGQPRPLIAEWSDFDWVMQPVATSSNIGPPGTEQRSVKKRFRD
ncbi:hypothetical protein FRC07_014820 [Ceratobasidium sp. 392]|nr:hypothetical protein FRC07_014820 [Ceratobasidium sp. 392]